MFGRLYNIVRRNIKVTAIAKAVTEDNFVVIIPRAYRYFFYTVMTHNLRKTVQRVMQFIYISPENPTYCTDIASSQHPDTA